MTSYDMIAHQAVKTAKEKHLLSTNGDPDYFTGGFDIIKKLVKKQRKNMPIRKYESKKDSYQPIEESPDEPIVR